MFCNYCFNEVEISWASFCPHCGNKICSELLYAKGDSVTNDVYSNSEHRIITADCEQFLTGEMAMDDDNRWPLIENDIIYQQTPYFYTSKFIDLTGNEIQLETPYDKELFENTIIYTTRKYKLIIDEKRFNVDCYSLDDELLKISKDNRYGFIDLEGREVVPCIYDSAERFKYGMCVVQRQRQKFIINKSNTIIASFDSFQKYIRITIVSNDLFSVTEIQDKSHSCPYGRIYNKDGRILYEQELMGCIEHMGESYYQFDAYGNGRRELYKYSDGKLNKVDDWNLKGYNFGYFRNGLMHLRKFTTAPETHAWMDTSGKVHRPIGHMRYLYNFEPSIDGYIMVQTFGDKDRNRWCLWNVFTDSKEHEYTGQYTRFFRCYFSEGLIPFKLYNGQTGYMRIDGTIAFMTELPCENLGDFHNGIALIETNDGIAFINIEGKRITPYMYDRVSYCHHSGAFLAHLKDNYIDKFNGGDSHLIFKKANYCHINGFQSGERISRDYQLKIIPKLFSNQQDFALVGQISETSIRNIKDWLKRQNM